MQYFCDQLSIGTFWTPYNSSDACQENTSFQTSRLIVCACDLERSKGVYVMWYPAAGEIQPFPIRSRLESVWRAWFWIGPAGMVVEGLRHVRFDIWKSEWLAFVSAPGPALTLNVSCIELLGGKFTYRHRQMNIAYWSAYETGGSDPAGGLQHRFNDAQSPQWLLCVLWIQVLHKCFYPWLGFVLLLIYIKTCHRVLLWPQKHL